MVRIASIQIRSRYRQISLNGTSKSPPAGWITRVHCPSSSTLAWPAEESGTELADGLERFTEDRRWVRVLSYCEMGRHEPDWQTVRRWEPSQLNRKQLRHSAQPSKTSL